MLHIIINSNVTSLLIIAGGRIDHAHHDTNGHRALTEVLSLSDAVNMASDLTSAEDTLIVVTADHDHPFTMAGWPMYIKTPILGTVNVSPTSFCITLFTYFK